MEFFQPSFFFMERGENSMSGDEFVEISMLIALVVLFINVLVAYLMVKKDEKEHEKRMKEIKEKEQV